MEHRPKVLIVEDDALVALAMEDVLSLVGFNVTSVAATVSDALCHAEITRPEIAVFDVKLAGKRDGIEGARILRGMFNIPVVFVTATLDAELQARAEAIGRAAVLHKPVPSHQIISAVQNALKSAGAESSHAPGRFE
jgi:two-component system, response regulator PdtaR